MRPSLIRRRPRERWSSLRATGRTSRGRGISGRSARGPPDARRPVHESGSMLRCAPLPGQAFSQAVAGCSHYRPPAGDPRDPPRDPCSVTAVSEIWDDIGHGEGKERVFGSGWRWCVSIVRIGSCDAHLRFFDNASCQLIGDDDDPSDGVLERARVGDRCRDGLPVDSVWRASVPTVPDAFLTTTCSTNLRTRSNAPMSKEWLAGADLSGVPLVLTRASRVIIDGHGPTEHASAQDVVCVCKAVFTVFGACRRGTASIG